MRESRTYGSVRGMLSNGHSYRDKMHSLVMLLTMRGWMFVKAFAALRKEVLESSGITCIGDFDRGAFEEVPNEVLAVSAVALMKGLQGDGLATAILPTPLGDASYDRQRTRRKVAATHCHVGKHLFNRHRFVNIIDCVFAYWWPDDLIVQYAESEK